MKNYLKYMWNNSELVLTGYCLIARQISSTVKREESENLKNKKIEYQEEMDGDDISKQDYNQ
jgi:hypothetical protein